MGELSIHFRDDAIDVGEDGKLLGRIPMQSVNPDGVALLRRENQLRMGTVPYQSFLAGVLSGVTLLFGPPQLVDVPVDAPADEGEPKSVPTTFDGMLPGELASIPTDEEMLGVLGHPVANQNLPQDPGGVLAISPELLHASALEEQKPTGSSSENSASSESTS